MNLLHLHHRLQDNDITLPKLLLLQHLPITPTEAAKLLHISTAGVSSMLEIMEREDLILRGHSMEDRRKVNIQPTPHGKKVMEKTLKEIGA